MLDSGASPSFLQISHAAACRIKSGTFQTKPCTLCSSHILLHLLIFVSPLRLYLCALNVAKSVTQLTSRPYSAAFDGAYLSPSLSDRAPLHTRHCFPLRYTVSPSVVSGCCLDNSLDLSLDLAPVYHCVSLLKF